VKVTERNLGLGLPAYASEAARRFKLDVVQDKEALEGASDDRVRAEFKSILRELNFMNEEDTVEDYSAFKGKNLIVDVFFGVREPTEWSDSDPNARPYRGADEYPSVFLRSLYLNLTSSTWGGALEELFPLQNRCY
jgi:hypothetical protein